MTTIAPAEFTFSADHLDVEAAAAAYQEHGCLVVRGLGRAYVEELVADADASAREALAALAQARPDPGIGWWGPDGSLFLPAPEGFGREQQIQILGMGYQTSAAMLRLALDPLALDLAEAVLGPDIELFQQGQVPYKEPGGGYAKLLHQDAIYFDHAGEGPMAAMVYGVDTDLVNGALWVAPGTHREGTLPHVDTATHQGLEWSWERAVPVCGAAGDAIFFHVRTVHGSRENRSARPRPSFITRYRRPDDYILVGGITTAQRAASEARGGPAQKPAHERGLMARGRRRAVA